MNSDDSGFLKLSREAFKAAWDTTGSDPEEPHVNHNLVITISSGGEQNEYKKEENKFRRNNSNIYFFVGVRDFSSEDRGIG